MKTIQQAMIESIYLQATELSKDNNQVTVHQGRKREYYITIQQLEAIIKSFED